MSEKPALHLSMMSLMSKCPMAFEFRYIKGIKRPPGVALVIGTAVHKACELDLIHKMKTGQPAPMAEVKQKAAEALDATWLGEEPMLDAEEKSRGKNLVRAEAKDEAVALSAVANRELTPVLEPIALEHKIRLEVKGFPYDIEGTVDVIEAHTIRDRKTAAKSPSEGDADGHPQLELYTMMRTIETGQQINTIALDVLVKTKVPKAVTVKAPAPRNFDSIKKRLELMAKVIDAGAFMPVDPTGPSGWACSERWCGFWDICDFGRKRKVQV